MRPVMNGFGQFSGLRISGRSFAVAGALGGAVPLAIRAHAALNMRSLDIATAASSEQAANALRRPSRIALVIGNGHYPDANAPLSQPVNDARAVSAALRHEGFDV